jgi:hypothetical protein
MRARAGLENGTGGLPNACAKAARPHSLREAGKRMALCGLAFSNTVPCLPKRMIFLSYLPDREH